MNHYSLLEAHPIIANAWKNNAVRSALIGGIGGGAINRMRGDSFTKGALVGGAIGAAGNGIYQTGKMSKTMKQLDKVHNSAKNTFYDLKNSSTKNGLLAKQIEKSNRTLAQQIKRDNTARALRDARRIGSRDAIYKIVSQSHDLMNNPQRIMRNPNIDIRGVRDSAYIASLRKNRV